jgi:hypothetical protein
MGGCVLAYWAERSLELVLANGLLLAKVKAIIGDSVQLQISTMIASFCCLILPLIEY